MQAQPTFYFNKPLGSEIVPQGYYASEYINMFAQVLSRKVEVL